MIVYNIWYVSILYIHNPHISLQHFVEDDVNYTCRSISFDVAMKPSPVPCWMATWKATLAWRRLRSPMSRRRCQLQFWAGSKKVKNTRIPTDLADLVHALLHCPVFFHAVCRRRAIKSRSNLYCTCPGPLFGIFELECYDDYYDYYGILWLLWNTISI